MMKHQLDLWFVGQDTEDFSTLLFSYLLLKLLSPLVGFTNKINSVTKGDKGPCASKLKRLEMTQFECW